MNDLCNRFYFAKDMNGDFAFTISDVWLLAKAIWLIPAKAVMLIVDNSAGMGRFFEASCSTGESWGGAIFSFFGWILILGVVGLLIDELENRA